MLRYWCYQYRQYNQYNWERHLYRLFWLYRKGVF
jgi:hypothetical protein